MTQTMDFLIVGTGIIGINLALELRRRYPRASIRLIEKESFAGAHASGRNSGVLHAGLYYPADSLKARFARDGNHIMTLYCQERGLRINRCGKLVVAVDEKDLEGLKVLQSRAQANGVELELLNPITAQTRYPELKKPLAVLYSPTTATVDPREVLSSLIQEAVHLGVDIRYQCPYLGRNRNGIRVGQDLVECGYFINAAGLYADHIATDFGFAKDVAIVPFKGLYLKYSGNADPISTNIYPVPDLNNPFLGVHYTVTVDGKLKIGPTAIPAFWREHYHGISRFKPLEMVDILFRQGKLFKNNHFGFRRLAFQEMAKMHKGTMLRLASRLAHLPGPVEAWQWGPAGIRAQLIRKSDCSLMMDFHFEGDSHSFHVLNAISPGFTCALPFSRFLCDRITSLMT
ncbi:MAG: FAD-dependent oxidoreductase [Magnetococcales bacterium]|nr:FAD-dependent oxidoreductase [Magnetococcales bacterium]